MSEEYEAYKADYSVRKKLKLLAPMQQLKKRPVNLYKNRSHTVNDGSYEDSPAEGYDYYNHNSYKLPFKQFRLREISIKPVSPKKFREPEEQKPIGGKCKSEKCTICRRYKSISAKIQEQEQPRGSLLPLIQSRMIPQKVKIRPQYPLEEGLSMRQAISVIKLKDEQEYDYNDLMNTKVKEKFSEERTSKLVRSKRPRLKTEVLPGYESRIVRINDKLYEIVDDEGRNVKDQEEEKMNRYRKQLEDLRQYREKWKKVAEEKNRQRQQLNKKVNQCIKCETVFYLQTKETLGRVFSMVDGQSQPGSAILEKLPLSAEKSNEKVSTLSNPAKEQPEPVQSQIPQPATNFDEQQKQIYAIKFPTLSEIDLVMSKYQSLTGELDLQKLKKGNDYIREYSDQPGKQYLYFGGFDHSKKQRRGYGVLVTKAYIFQGYWSKNTLTKGAELRHQYIYRGQFKNNKKHGEGKCVWLNGEQYVGEWANGLRNGQGSWSSRGADETYSGEWKNGKVEGYGEYIKKGYSTYRGNFIDFVKEGQGDEEFPNGDRYEGPYLEGCPEGIGKYTWKNGLVFVGQFKRGLRAGKGLLKMQNVFQLQGDFQNQRPHGFCHLKLQNGDEFNGKFIYGSKYGFGTLYKGENNVEQSGFWNHENLQTKLALQQSNSRQA